MTRFGLRIRAVAVLRLVAAISLLAVGGVHIQQYTVQDYRVIPTIRPLFLFNFIGGTVLGIYFLVPARPRAGRVRLLIDALCALAGWFVAGGALLALLIREDTPLFGFMEHGYRFAIVFAIASEAVAVVTLTIVLFLDRREARRNRTPRRHGPLTVVRAPDAST
ncbi:MAG TPA: hypothetical protein VFH80_24025 [Solirubrobacteraceae bacterium]|nr:hypothetical protein [Solirubrobacteraceae bacterium]